MKEINIQHNWSSLSFRDKLSYVFAIAAFIAGWTFTALGFFAEPLGDISDSVLIVLGQSLLFAGSIIGIAQYYSGQLNDFKHSVMNQLKGHGSEVETDESE